MPESDQRIAHVSDTALMVAACRARETARPDGFVSDPFAGRLAGPRGMAILEALPRAEIMCFGVGVRSRFMEEFVGLAISRGVSTVLSLGCGLDTRPWRLDLPATLRWVEVDFPEMLDYKAAVMRDETPRCRLERVAADLNDAAGRRAIYETAPDAPAMLITEGLLMYLPTETVESLAAEASRMSGARYWLLDLTSPAFAKTVGMDTFRDVQKVRAAGAADGTTILSALQRNGWDFVESRRYATPIWGFAAERLRKAAEARRQAGIVEPPPSFAPDDPTGVHLFGVA